MQGKKKSVLLQKRKGGTLQRGGGGTKSTSTRGAEKKAAKPRQQPPQIREEDDEEILSDEIPSGDEEEMATTKTGAFERDGAGGDDEEEEEDPDRKRIRMAKKILKEYEDEAKVQRAARPKDDFFLGAEDDEDQARQQAIDEEEEKTGIYRADDDDVTRMLQAKLKKKRHLIFKKIANDIEGSYEEKKGDVTSVELKGHKRCITCVEFDPMKKVLYSAGKDSAIIKWDIETGSKLIIQTGQQGSKNQNMGHWDEILAMDLSFDGKYLVTAGKDRLIHVWDAENLALLTTLKGHRGSIQGVKFRLNSTEFCTVGCDRTLKIWDAAERAYIDSHYGHESDITAIDVLGEGRMVTSGADKHAVVWRIQEESQLVFTGHDSAIDCIKGINHNHFITGGQDGALSLWNSGKKKPLSTLSAVHGQENWITALGHYYNSDLVISGSTDSRVKFHKIDMETSSLIDMFSLPCDGIATDIKVDSEGRLVAIAQGPEHRLGRWVTAKCKNSIKIYRF